MSQQQKTNTNMDKEFAIWLALGVLLVTLCFSWVNFSACVSRLEIGSEGHSLVNYLSASAQRLVKLEIRGTESDELIFNLDNTMMELSEVDGISAEYFDDSAEILQAMAAVSSAWDDVKASVEAFRLDGDAATALVADSERLFYYAADLSNQTADYISVLSKTILRLQWLMIFQLLAIALVIGYRLFVAFAELRRNRALSAAMSIDTATGLFNRSKCHEVLRIAAGTGVSRGMIVFDLNDLKKTNDVYGHRVGDELIYSFAQLIEKGAKVHTKDVFIGRYGGDEFMVYYNDIEQEELRLYLEEVAFLTEAFNENETRFQVSYAVGYAMMLPNQDEMTLRQLFDIADQEMYRNKVEMKKKRSASQAAQVGATVQEGQVTTDA